MKNIEVKVLNEQAVFESERMMVAMGRLTQRGHAINSMADFEALINADYKITTVEAMSALPHPTIQKFGLINIAIVGASRRFLAQITRHQNEVKFMSGSLQYSDYSDDAQFCIPYEILKADAEDFGIKEPSSDEYIKATEFYLRGCRRDLEEYKALADLVGNDAAGYKMPQGMRNVVMISALPYEWKHIMKQRTCSRNTLETQYVLLKVWEQLQDLSPMFQDCGPSCMYKGCEEGKMSCGCAIYSKATPDEILDEAFSLIR